MRKVIALVLGAVMLLPLSTSASDIEADVINGPLETLFAYESFSDITEAEWDTMIADAVDIYGDTQYGDCQSYSGTSVGYLTTLRQGYLSESDGPWWEFDVATTLYWELNRMEDACRDA